MNNNIIDFFRDSAWGAADAIGGILFGIFGVILTIRYFKKTNKKQLSYRVISIDKLIKNFDIINKDQIKLSYNSHDVENLTILNIEIVNNGYVSISKNDFEESLKIGFGDNSKILSSIVKDKLPDNLEPIINIVNDNQIIVASLLLNKNDKFTISNVVSEYSNLSINARILGVSKILDITSSSVLYDANLLDYKKEIIEVLFLAIGGLVFAILKGDVSFSVVGISSVYLIYLLLNSMERRFR